MIKMEFFNRLSKTERMGVIAAAIVVTLVLIDRLVITPIGDKIQRIDQEIKLSEKKLSRGLRNMNNKDLIESEYKKYKNYVKRTSASDEEDVANTLDEIETLARKCAVSLASIKPQSTKEVDFYKIYSIEIEVEGGMPQIMTFLYDLNNSKHLLRTVKLRIGLRERESSVVRASLLVTRISM